MKKVSKILLVILCLALLGAMIYLIVIGCLPNTSTSGGNSCGGGSCTIG